MAVYDWIFAVDPQSGAKIMERTYDLLAHIATTFPPRREATEQLDALLARNSKGERAKRVRENRKWHGVKTRKQPGGGGSIGGDAGHGGALALWDVPGFQERSTKEDFAQVWHEAAHLATECVQITQCLCCVVLCFALV